MIDPFNGREACGVVDLCKENAQLVLRMSVERVLERRVASMEEAVVSMSVVPGCKVEKVKWYGGLCDCT